MEKKDKKKIPPAPPYELPDGGESPIPLEMLKKLLTPRSLPIKHTTLQCDFIEIDSWLIDLAKVTHARIDSGHIMLAQLGGTTLIFENREAAMDLVPSANQLKPEPFEALASYLRIRFNPDPVQTNGGWISANEHRDEDSDK